MRTKVEILREVKNDIQDPIYKSSRAIWVDYRKLEVLIDIRDAIKERSDNSLKAAEIDHETMKLVHAKQ